MPNKAPNPYDRFRQVTYEKVNPGKPLDEVLDLKTQIKYEIGSTTLLAADVYSTLTEGMWVSGEDSLKVLMAVESMSLNSEPYWRVDKSAYEPLVYSPEELIKYALSTGSTNILIDCLVEVANSYREFWGNVPCGLGRWIVELSGVANAEQRPGVIGATKGIKYSYGSIDSEDSEDLHPVEHALSEIEDSDLDLQIAFLDGAQQDADSPKVKWVWGNQLRNTLRYIAKNADDPLRFECRRRLGLPEDDEGYHEYLELENARRIEEEHLANMEREDRLSRSRDKRHAEVAGHIEIVRKALNAVFGEQ